MQSISTPFRYKNKEVLSPGVVGSVGDTLLSVRLKHSAPDLPLRFDTMTVGPKEKRLGSNVQDGDLKSFDSKGGPARTLDSNWLGRERRLAHGFKYQDLRAPDKRFEPIHMGAPGYEFDNRIATMYDIRRPGDQFLPLPGPYQITPGEVPRGGAAPRLFATESGPAPYTYQGAQPGVEGVTETLPLFVRSSPLAPPPQRFM